MSTSTIARLPLAARARGLGGLAVGLAVGLAALAALFHAEIVAAVLVWSASTAYSHCFFVVPIAAYLAWDRRFAIAQAPIAPFPLALLAAIPLSLAWLFAERLGIMEGRQILLIGLLQVLCLTLLGARMWWALSVPLLYLFFLVPFGAFITPQLQHFTARFIAVGLDVLGVANEASDTTIEIPEGSFVVAEACAGLRFLIASVAFGVLYACVIYRGVWRRAAFIAVSIAVPIVANGVRALGIVMLGHILGSADAVEADHVLYGWMFFSIVILLLIAAGLPFRQDEATPFVPRQAVADASMPARRMAVLAVLFALFAAAGPAAAMAFDRAGRTAPMPVRPGFAEAAGCIVDGGAVSKHAELLGYPAAISTFQCGPLRLLATVVTLPKRANPARLALVQRRLTGEEAADDSISHPLAVAAIAPSTWRQTETSDPVQVTAMSFWIDGAPAQADMRGRARQALDSVFGGKSAPVAVAIALKFPGIRLAPPAREAAISLLSAFLAGQLTLDEQIRTLSRAGEP